MITREEMVGKLQYAVMLLKEAAQGMDPHQPNDHHHLVFLTRAVNDIRSTMRYLEANNG